MSYPEEFVARVEREYADWPEVVELARGNKYLLGRLLMEGASQQMSPEDVVRAFESGRPDSVLENALSAIRRRALHRDWLRMMVQKVESIGEDSPSSKRREAQALRNGARRL